MASETPFPVAVAKPGYLTVLSNFSEIDVGKVVVGAAAGLALGSWAGGAKFRAAGLGASATLGAFTGLCIAYQDSAFRLLGYSENSAEQRKFS